MGAKFYPPTEYGEHWLFQVSLVTAHFALRCDKVLFPASLHVHSHLLWLIKGILGLEVYYITRFYASEGSLSVPLMNDAVRISEISTYVRDKAFILGIFNVLSESRLKFEFHDKMRCYFQGFAVASFGYHTFSEVFWDTFFLAGLTQLLNHSLEYWSFWGLRLCKLYSFGL